jgi:SagB-type dehydrogenase family enzyme
MTRPVPALTYPVVLACPRVEANALVFSISNQTIAIEGDVDLLLALLGRCDGLVAFEELLAELDAADGATVRSVFETLRRFGLVTDRNDTYRRAHLDASLPDGIAAATTSRGLLPAEPCRPDRLTTASHHVPPPTGPYAALLRRRRTGEPGKALDLSAIRQIVACANGRVPGGRRAVPSAGALYAAEIHVGVIDGIRGLGSGWWWFDAAADRLVGVETASAQPMRELFYVRDEVQASVDHAACILALSMDLGRTTATYAGRAPRYGLIEVGAAMQNALLAATELGVAARPLGLFDDGLLAEALALTRDVSPVLGIALG